MRIAVMILRDISVLISRSRFFVNTVENPDLIVDTEPERQPKRTQSPSKSASRQVGTSLTTCRILRSGYLAGMRL